MSLGPILVNPAGADSESAAPACLTLTALAANSVSAGEVVALSTSPGYVIRNLVATSAGLQTGVALNTAGTGKAVEVVVGGWATVLKGTLSMTANDLAGADATVSGTVNSISAATAVTQAKDVRGFVGTVVVAASAAATTVTLLVGKF